LRRLIFSFAASCEARALAAAGNLANPDRAARPERDQSPPL
jgi:hypothetical protein